MNKAVIQFFITLFIGCISAFCNLSLSLYTGKIINNFQEQHSRTTLLNLFFIFIIMILLASIGQYIVQILSNKIAYQCVHQLRMKASAYLNTSNMASLQNFSSGNIAQLLTNDIENISNALSQILNQICFGIPTIIITLVFMIHTNIPLTLVVLVISPLTLGFMGIIAKKSRSYFIKQQDILAHMANLTEEYIPNIELIHFFNQEDNIYQQFIDTNQSLKKWGQKAQWISSLTNPLSRFVDHLTYLGIGLVSGYIFFINPTANDIGIISSFILYAGQFSKPFIELSSLTTQIETAKASYNRFCNWYKEEHSKDEPQLALTNTNGQISIQNVSFEYTPNKKVLQHININIKSGQKVAIIGETGSGKSTLIQLLLKFYQPSSGQILIDGHDINKYSSKSIRNLISVVMQEPWLFKGSLRDNLCLKTKKEDGILIDILQQIELDDFYHKLPYGLSTIINPKALSAGQRQLLTIARVMVESPDILILDEATSTLDYVTEQKVTRALEKVMENRTTLLIAHKLSTIQNVDYLYALQKGCIIEEGVPSNLKKQPNSYYSKLLSIHHKGGSI